MTDPRQLVMESIVREIGRQIGSELEDIKTGPRMGFMLMIFDFGDGGFSSYISNAQRSDMVRALREQADRMEAGTDATKGRL